MEKTFRLYSGREITLDILSKEKVEELISELNTTNISKELYQELTNAMVRYNYQLNIRTGECNWVRYTAGSHDELVDYVSLVEYIFRNPLEVATESLDFYFDSIAVELYEKYKDEEGMTTVVPYRDEIYDVSGVVIDYCHDQYELASKIARMYSKDDLASIFSESFLVEIDWESVREQISRIYE